MKTQLSTDRSYRTSITVLFIFTLLSLIGTAFIGEFLLPVCAAFYAALLVFEQNKRVLSVICALFGIGLVFVPLVVPPMWGIASLMCGAILYLLYRHDNTKCDSAIVLTLALSFAIVFSFFLVAFVETGIYTFDSAVKFYTDIYENIRASFIFGMSQTGIAISEEIGEIQFDSEQLAAIFDTAFRLLVSFVVIIAFILAGLTLKIFCAIVRRFVDDDSEIKAWRFAVPSIYAYVYVIFFFVSSFAYGESVLEVSILNLTGIFASIFAYIGLKAVFEMFTKKNRKVFGTVIIVFAAVFLGTLAVNALSVFGVIYTIQQNKSLKKGQGSSSGS